MALFGSQRAGATGSSSERIAAWAFGVYLAAALPVLVYLGSDYWFMADEWAFLVGGSVADPAVLFRPINTHWSTLPMLLYRGLYNAFGLHSYLPFQLCVILLHLTLCYLLRVIMRRAGVEPWLATIAASLFILFEPGKENFLLGIQVSQVGSMVFGFTHLILADHDGRINRRDCLGLVCGLGSIMSSGIGPPLVAIVGLAALLRRGWGPSIFHTLPLAAVYVIWMASNYTELPTDQAYPTFITIVTSVILSVIATFLALGGLTGIAVALGALLVVGLLLVWRDISLPMHRQRVYLPIAMLLGALTLQILICTQRYWLGLDAALSSRYVAMYASLTLPALAVATDAVVRRWQLLRVVVFALFLIGLGVNASRLGFSPIKPPLFSVNSRAALLGVAYSPLAEQVPADLRPDPNVFASGAIDMAFLLGARNSGRLPPAPKMTAALESRTQLRLSVQQLAGPIPATLSCSNHNAPIEIEPIKGNFLGFTTPIRISLGKTGAPLGFNSGLGGLPVIQILRPDLTLRLAPQPPATSFGFCQ